MYQKTINYVDYNGNNRSEKYWFHMTKPKLAKTFAKFYPDVAKQQNLSIADYRAAVAKIVDEKDPNELIDMFEYLILNSYGIKSEDGTSFEQSEELSRKFSNTAAYSSFFMELFAKPSEMIEFFNRVVPSDISDSINIDNVSNVVQMTGTPQSPYDTIAPAQVMNQNINPNIQVLPQPISTLGGTSGNANFNNPGN